MKVLNRPMFRYGGPIKEGIMSGIKEPRQGYANGPGFVIQNDPNKMAVAKALKNAEAFKNIFTPNVNKTIQDNKLQSDNQINKISSFDKMIKNNQFGNQEPIIVPKPTIEDKIKSYTPNPENPFRDILDYTDKLNVYVDEDGVKRNRNTGKVVIDTDVSEVITEPRGGGADMSKLPATKPDVKLPGDNDTPPPTKKERVNTILESLGYDRAQKNALYDAMIKAGQRISRAGLGAENLVSDVISETSQSYDKPEKLREAANLMDVQQQLKLDQIEAGKDTEGTLEKNAKYLLESGVADNAKDAVLSAQGKATEANDIFFEASQKLNSSKALDQTALTLGARGKFGEGIVFKNKVPKKYKGEPIEKFLESGAFRGDGLYTADGKIMLIQDGKIKSELIIRGSIEEGLFSFGGDD